MGNGDWVCQCRAGNGGDWLVGGNAMRVRQQTSNDSKDKKKKMQK